MTDERTGAPNAAGTGTAAIGGGRSCPALAEGDVTMPITSWLYRLATHVHDWRIIEDGKRHTTYRCAICDARKVVLKQEAMKP